MAALVIERLRVIEYTPEGKREALAMEHVVIPTFGLWAVLGANFSGRTALLKALAGELNHCHVYKVDCQVLWSHDQEARSSSIVPEEDAVYLGGSPANLISGLTDSVAEEIALHRSCRWRKAEALNNVDLDRWVHALRLPPVWNRSPLDLSGGQTAAVALLAGLCLGRPIVCADGLLGQLDRCARDAAYACLKAYACAGAWVFVAENTVDGLMDAATGALLLADGRMTFLGPVIAACATHVAYEAGTVPTALRYACLLADEEWDSGIHPFSDKEFIEWVGARYGLR